MMLNTYKRTYSEETGREIEDFTVTRGYGCMHTECCPLEPGKWVSHVRYGGHGMLVAVSADELTVLWTHEPIWPNWANFTFPKVRRVCMQSIAAQIMQVQPMTGLLA